MRIRLVTALLLVLPLSAQACFNDNQTLILEQEFRSRYESAAAPGSGSASQPADATVMTARYEWNDHGFMVAGVGLGLICVSLFLARWKLRPRNVDA